MLPIYIKQIAASAAGKRVAEVTCDRCHCVYYYELARVGLGSGAAPYGIGQNVAQQSADLAATDNLKQRLTHEAELVACPKCHWISSALVQGYRRTRYRALTTAAMVVAGIGVALSLVVAWAMRTGPQTDRWLIPYVLLGGPLLSLSGAAALLLCQRILRQRIQPNAHFPHAPHLPPGTPPALREDPATGVLLPATSNPPTNGEAASEVVIQLGRHTLPNTCCVCLAEAEPASAFAVIVARGAQLALPRCAACARQAHARCVRNRWLAFGALLVAGGLLHVRWQFADAEFWIYWLLALLIIYPLTATVNHRGERPARVTVADAARGLLRVRFRNPAFTRLVETRD